MPAVDVTYQPKVYRTQGGNELQIAPGGLLTMNGQACCIQRGMATTVTATDTIVTGLATVICAFANLEDAPLLTVDSATAQVGNQAGAPAAGSIILQTWMPTSATNPTKIAATTFSKKVSWVAIGTL